MNIGVSTGSVKQLHDILTRLGGEGWEVVATAGVDKTIGVNAVVLIAKRLCVPPAPPPSLEAEWHDDPTGRFDKRYWDGRQWSVHVGTVSPKSTGIDPPTMLGPTAVV